MLLSTALLERMRNNFMVIEVWDKKTSAENDQVSFINVIFSLSL
jgi:C2 domain-containing protein 3